MQKSNLKYKYFRRKPICQSSACRRERRAKLVATLQGNDVLEAIWKILCQKDQYCSCSLRRYGSSIYWCTSSQRSCFLAYAYVACFSIGYCTPTNFFGGNSSLSSIHYLGSLSTVYVNSSSLTYKHHILLLGKGRGLAKLHEGGDPVEQELEGRPISHAHD